MDMNGYPHAPPGEGDIVAHGMRSWFGSWTVLNALGEESVALTRIYTPKLPALILFTIQTMLSRLR